MARGFNYQQPYILLNKNKGIGFKYDKKSPFYDKIKEDIRVIEDEENKRLLYVAMTRAEKRLIIGNQGKYNGFKKMIKDLIDLDHVEIIDRVKINPKLKEPIRELHDKSFQNKPLDNKKFPLLQVMEGYNQRLFSRISPSQYLDFNQCRRRFFLNYYNRISLDFSNSNTRETSFILNPINKGNIVHKFCQHYKIGVEPDKLMKKVVNSFGLEYDEFIKQELSPYVKNYIQYHREDYDQVYSEKEFYLKVEDVHLYGIIDRINIKNGKAEILDFKTNRVYNKKRLVKIYEPQLQLYANALRKITNMQIERAAILFLETGEIGEIDISKESLETNFENIKKFIQFINCNNSIDQYNKSNECEGDCEYSILCNID
jgi:ATP-dependent helicase/nuclease subunit A